MRKTLAISGAAGLLLLAGCAGPSTSPSVEPGAIEVVAAFYPLAFVAEQVAGDRASVTSLAAPGVEPHDLELSPASVRELGNADMVIYLDEFQPAVDDAVGTTGATALDAARFIALHEHAEDEHTQDEAHEDHDHGSTDPHFWLEPLLLAELGDEIAAELSLLDPASAAAYRDNAEALRTSMAELDFAFSEGLAQCERREIVTSHEAFGYLAEAYGLEQIGLAGFDPDAEPSPARVREITTIVERSGASTVFTESASGGSALEAIAHDAGVDIAVLDPVETVTGTDDYIAVMTRNLAALRAALDCD